MIDPKTNKKIVFMVYGGSKETPLYISEDICKCIDFMNEPRLSSLQCYTIKAAALE